MKLKLGVIEVPEPQGDITSYDLGMILENKYGLFSNFYKYHEKDILKDIDDTFSKAIDSVMNGDTRSAVGSIFGVNERITDKLHKFITDREIEQMGIPGVPTEAALLGLSLRTKGNKRIGKAKKGVKYKQVQGPRRPSFIYSGVFEASLKAWLE